MAVEFRILGPLEARIGGRRVDLGGSRARVLLAVLLAAGGRRVSVDRLIDGIWGPAAGGETKHTLHVHVSNLRKALEPGHRAGEPWTVVETVGDGYRIDPGPDGLDATRFERLAREGRAVLEAGDAARAVELLHAAEREWRGRAFGELASLEPLVAAAGRLEELRISATEDRIEAGLALGHHAELVAELRDLVEEHPFRERLAGQLMLALYRAGRQAQALRVYRSKADELGRELGIEPNPRLRELEEAILLQAPELDAPVRAGSGVVALPEVPTSFVGRDADMRRLLERADAARLVTITGPGGVGKTRLALEAARRARDASPDGIWFVELAPLRDDRLVAQTVGAVVGIEQQPGRSIERTLVDRLGDRDVLVILDNCEHVVGRTAELVDLLLAGCPRLRIWATSREPIGTPGEHRLVVSGLPVIDGSSDDAVALFVDRATAVSDGFVLDESDAPTVARICRRLGGLPLAIELAAARSDILSVDQIDEGLDDRFRLLTTGPRTADARQRTLAAAIDWSHRLLDEREREIFRRLSAFRGPFGVDAATAVCLPGEPAAARDVLGRLVAKSLVVAEPGDGEMRFELPETIRLYARRKLEESGERAEVFDRHRDWIVAMTDRAGPGLRGPDQLEWLRRLESDHADIRAVLERSRAAGDVATALRVAGSVGSFWFLHSHLAEGWHWFESLLELAEEVPAPLRARALIAAGQFAWEQGEDTTARAWLEEARRLGEGSGSRSLAAWATAYLGLLSMLEGDWEAGDRFATRAQDEFEEIGHLGGMSFSRWIASGAAYFRARESGSPSTERAVRAVETLAELLELARGIGDRNLVGHLEWSLAIAALDRPDAGAAVPHLASALAAFGELGNASCTGHTLDQVARLAIVEGRPSRAARILGASEALRERLGIPGYGFEMGMWEACRDDVARALSPDVLAEAWDDGRHLDVDQAIAYAIGGLRTPAADPTADDPHP